MAVWSIVRASELQRANRLDAEYYSPGYVRLARRLSRHTTTALRAMAQVTDGIHASAMFEPGSGIRYISAKCVRDCYFDLSTVEEISPVQHAANPRTALRTNDVIISTVGTIGFCAVVDEDLLPANCDRHVGIVRIRDITRFDPHFVAAFLNSKYGRNQTIREATGNVQLNLFIYAIAKVEVPFFSGHQRIGDIVRKGLSLLKRSESLYLKAERTVLEELRWDKLDLSEPKWYTVSLSRSREVHRLDAEHFQPKYDRLMAHLKKTGRAKQIGDIMAEPIQKGVTPDYEPNGSIVAVNSQHLARHCLNFEATDRTTEEFWQDNRKARIRQNDVMIYATGAYIGRTNPYLETATALAGVDILLVRPIGECNPLYLATFLNAPPGLIQSKKFASGSGQAHIYPHDVSLYWVYLPTEHLQHQVADLVQQSYEARQKPRRFWKELRPR